MMQLRKSGLDLPTISGDHAGEDWLDRTALVASTACVIHCLLLPVLLAALPTLDASFGAKPWLHHLMLVLIVPTSGFALLLGWRRRRVASALMLGLVGLTFLSAGVVMGEVRGETIVTVCGSLLLATAHVINWRSRRGDCARTRG